MLVTHCLTNFAVLSFEIASYWKLSFIKLTFLVRLTRLLGLISLAHRATELLFSLAQEQNLLALSNQTFFLFQGFIIELTLLHKSNTSR